MAIELYEDQQQALARVLAEYKARPIGGSAQIVAPTGWGKTIFFSALAHALKGINVLIIAHRDELLNQAREKYLMIDPTAIVGKVGGGAHERGAPVTVAGIDTIGQPHFIKNLHKFNYRLVIWDENHHCQAPKYHKVRVALSEAFHVGVTATPDRLDGKSLVPLFGLPVFKMTIIEAIQKRRLCDVRAIAVSTDTVLDDIKTTKNADGEEDFNQRELENAVDNPARNRRIVSKWQELAEGRRSICFGVSVEHCQHITEAFIEAGIPAAYVTGKTTDTERKKMYSQLATGEIKVLSSIQVLTEGFDLPVVSCVIMARPTQSRALFTQSIGRGLRLAPGKRDCLVMDVTDNCYRLRLTPQNFRKNVGVNAKDGELLSDAVERIEDERAERIAGEKRALIRKLNERRTTDQHIDLFALPEWEERPGGMFVLTVGLQGHRIAIVPRGNSDWAQLYDIFARLAPDFRGQKWAEAQTLDGALQLAEKRARMLLQEPSSVQLVDRNAPWRSKTIDPNGKQVKYLKWKHIPYTLTMTRGEAQDLIDADREKTEARKQAKEQRKNARMEA